MKKIPTLFQRDPDDMRHVLREVHPDCQWVLDGEGAPTHKFDGTCFLYSNVEEKWWARREVKPGKTPPPGFVAVETDEFTGKTVGWEPAEQSPFAKYHAEALTSWHDPVLDEWPTRTPVPGATYELIGPKVNGNPEGMAGDHVLVRHGYLAAVDRDDLASLTLTFDGLRDWLLAHDWEGIVWHHPDGRMAKLKRRDFQAVMGRE